jgi:hypothetical protein
LHEAKRIVILVKTDKLPILDATHIAEPKFDLPTRRWNISSRTMECTGVGTATNKLNDRMILSSEQVGHFCPAVREGFCPTEKELLVPVMATKGHSKRDEEDLAVLCDRSKRLVEPSVVRLVVIVQVVGPPSESSIVLCSYCVFLSVLVLF